MTALAFAALIAFVLLVGGVTSALSWAVAEYGPSNSSDLAFASLANVPRRHLESRRAWQRRCSHAYDMRRCAYDTFIAAAQYEDTGPRTGVYSLSIQHPASVTLLAAQYPDGPPLPKLMELAGLDSETLQH